VTLFQFHSAAEATAFESLMMSQSSASALAHVNKTIRAVRGSSAIVSTAAGSDGFYVVDAGAVKGSMLMLLEYSNTSNPSGVPPVVSSSAIEQYGRLQALSAPTMARQVAESTSRGDVSISD